MVLILYLKAVKNRTDITAEEAAQLAAAKLQEQEKKSYIWYRVGAARLVSGSKRVTPLLDPRLQKVIAKILYYFPSKCYTYFGNKLMCHSIMI